MTLDPTEPETRQGLGVSPGVATAPAVAVRAALGVDPQEQATTDAAAAGSRVREALDAVAADLDARADAAPAEAQPVLQATAMMARDPGLLAAVDAQLTDGAGATHAVHDAVGGYCDQLAALGGYMAERVTDLQDVRDRVISHLRGVPAPGVPALTERSVLIARDLAPAETATLDRDLVAAIVTEAGGPTSHTAILAAQLGIPAVVHLPGATDVAEGTLLAVDGSAGTVVLSPTAEQQRELSERAERRASLLADSHGPGVTADGHHVALLANIGTEDDARAAAQTGVEGTGLFRTEFLFLDRDDSPGVDEQTRTYTAVLEAFGDRRVVVRTLDAGADKPLRFADLGEEANPALGRRGLRMGRAVPQLLDDQLTALAAAHRATGADLRVMAPMVATREEATWFAQKARAAGLPSVGVMVEVPAAALLADTVLADLDFASIGTNDLAQYVMAADRMEGELADLLDPWQPAVLRLVQLTCDGGVTAGASVGVCGEAGGDALLALVLVGLGVSSLSMAPSRVPSVRASLARHDLETCRVMARAALDAGSAQDARTAVLDLVHDDVRHLL